jgi:membrane protein DedA with SNARE-associated domain
VFPPIPSELVMPLGGFYVQQGKLELVPVILAGLIGTVLGAWFWYGIGRLINEQRIEHWLERHGKWIGIAPADLARSRRWFNRHGSALVFWGRIIPGVRTLISVPAGIEMMPQLPFLAWTTAGSLIWVIVLTLLGQGLGEGYERVELWIEPVARLVKVLLVMAAVLALGWIARNVIRQRRPR